MNTNDKLADWGLMPRKLTKEMGDAYNAACKHNNGGPVAWLVAKGYQAMLAAAPAPAVGDVISFELVERVCNTLSKLGVSVPESREEQAARVIGLIESLCDEAIESKQAPAVGGDGNMRNVIEAAFNLSMHVNIPEITPNIDGTITFEWETDAGVALMELSHDSYSFLMKTKKGERFTDTGRLDSAANIEALGANIQSALYQNLSVGGDVLEPLRVFDDGPWVWGPEGSALSGKDLDEAAYVKYKPFINNPPLTQGDAISPCLGCDSLACDDCRRRVINESEVAMDAERYRRVRDSNDLNGPRITTWDVHMNQPMYPSPVLCDALIDAIVAQTGGE